MTESSGGWWPDFEHYQRLRRNRRRELEEAEEEARSIQDQIDRDISALLREQEKRDAEREDLLRLQSLADQYAGQRLEELPKAARVAILNAQDARTRNSLEQMRRVIEQSHEEEMMVLQIVLLALD